MKPVERLRRQAAFTTFPQAARLVELAARHLPRRGARAEVGADTPPADEPLRFVASDRMALPISDIVAIAEDDKGAVRITANVLGLAGATPSLPPYYSETQLARRRLHDRSFASFLNIFDHRALSFFYRVFRKYNWLLAFEREERTTADPVTGTLLALAGFATPASRQRLSFEDGMLVPLVAHLGDMRRSAAGLESTLRHITGFELRVVQAEATWMALPLSEQSRLGTVDGQLARLGGEDRESGLGMLDAAVLGSAVLDVQHHYAVEIGPLPYPRFLEFCRAGGPLAMVRDICQLTAGIEHRPLVRLRIAVADIPPLRLGDDAVPALLGRTTWLGEPGPPDNVVSDCAITIAPTFTDARVWY